MPALVIGLHEGTVDFAPSSFDPTIRRPDYTTGGSDSPVSRTVLRLLRM
jgi:hypothetical protein